MIKALHAVRNQYKLKTLAESMEVNGWIGRPIIALDKGDHYQAITGSHRIAAAEAAGVDVELIEIVEPEYDGDDEVSDLFSKLIEGDDIDRLKSLKTLAYKGLVDEDVLKIMEEEI